MKKSGTEETLPTELTQGDIEEQFQKQAKENNATVVDNLRKWEENGYKASPNTLPSLEDIEKAFGSNGLPSSSNSFSESDRSIQAPVSIVIAPQNHQETVVARRQAQQVDQNNCCVIL